MMTNEMLEKMLQDPDWNSKYYEALSGNYRTLLAIKAEEVKGEA
jgi:hypothetical protein